MTLTIGASPVNTVISEKFASSELVARSPPDSRPTETRRGRIRYIYAMFTTYKVLLTLHILAAVIWVGGAAMLQMLGIRATRATSAEHQAAFAGDVEFVGMRALLPASLVLIVTGIWLVHEGSWGFGTAWVSIGLAVWIVSALTGALFLGPQSGKLSKEIETLGIRSPEAQKRLRTIFLTSRVELVLLLIVVCDMVLKPGQ
jgi:uncharacterized membrane protein